MVLSAALSGNVWADLNDGLVAYYPFNGNANDESGNGNDGTESTSLFYVKGKINLSARFNGSESIVANPSINNNSSFTVSAWVNPYIISDSGAQTILFERDKNGNDSCGNFSAGNYGVQIYNGKFAFETSTYMSDSSCDHSRIFATKIIQPNQYYYITAIYDKSATEIRLYVNANLEAKKSVGNELRTHSNAILTISRNGPLSSQNWNGELDEIRIYNRALSESEIQQLYKPEEEEKPPIEISSKAIYDSKTNTLSLEGILVPYIDDFTGKATDNQGIFDAQLQEKAKLVFELIPWSINFKDMFEGEDTSGYILYDYKTRSVEIPCFEVMTIAKFGD